MSVFPVSPRIAARARERYKVASVKDDRFDAFVLADTLRHEHAHWRPLAVAVPAAGRDQGADPGSGPAAGDSAGRRAPAADDPRGLPPGAGPAVLLGRPADHPVVRAGLSDAGRRRHGSRRPGWRASWLATTTPARLGAGAGRADAGPPAVRRHRAPWPGRASPRRRSPGCCNCSTASSPSSTTPSPPRSPSTPTRPSSPASPASARSPPRCCSPRSARTAAASPPPPCCSPRPASPRSPAPPAAPAASGSATPPTPGSARPRCGGRFNSMKESPWAAAAFRQARDQRGQRYHRALRGLVRPLDARPVALLDRPRPLRPRQAHQRSRTRLHRLTSPSSPAAGTGSRAARRHARQTPTLTERG